MSQTPFRAELRHPHGDAIVVEVDEPDLIDLSIQHGPHEICALGLSYAAAGKLMALLRAARRRAKPRQTETTTKS